MTLIRHGLIAQTLKLGRKEPIYSVLEQVNFLKKDDQNQLLQLKSIDESTGSLLQVHDVSIKEEDEFEEGKTIAPKKREKLVEFSSFSDVMNHRIAPLDNQGRCAISYQDKMLQWHLE